MDDLDPGARCGYGRRYPAVVSPTACRGEATIVSLLQRSSDNTAAIEDVTIQAGRIAAGYAPAYVVVDAADDVVLFSPGTGRFLDPAGAPTLHLPSLVSPGIAAELSRLMRWSRATGSARRTDGLLAPTVGGLSRLCLTVEPLPASGRLMVLFQQSAPGPIAQDLAQGGPDAMLQAELHHAKQQLHALTRELAFSNEEYQTSTEELETSNEELGAAGEALRSVNEELTARVGELAQANSDIRHMLQSTQIAIVFLNGDLRIRSFTPAAQNLFQLIDRDLGRPLTHLAANVAYPELAADVSRVLQTQDAVEREVDGLSGLRRYSVRVLPDRDEAGLAAGIVLAFIDITAAHQAKLARQDSEDRLHRMAASVPAFLFITGPVRGWDYVNPPFYAYTGMAAGAAMGWGWLAAIHPDDRAEAGAVWGAAHPDSAVEREIRIRRADGAWQWFLLRAVPQPGDDGEVVRWFGSCTDIDQRRQAEARQGRMLAELQHRVRNILALVRSLFMRTVRSSTDLDHFAHHFAGRIGALARSQTAAARTPEQMMMLDELVSEELSAHGGQDGRQTCIEGPDVALPEKVAGPIGLAVHELTTNALKYGALSTPAGRVDVHWVLKPILQEDGRKAESLILDWRETGVPLTDLNPSRYGFGRELIEQGLPYELGASTTLHFRPGGVRCRITLPLPSRTAADRNPVASS